MAEHTPTPWFKNRRLEIGPRPRTDDQHDGMLHPVADVFGENGEADAALIIKAVNNHEALVKAIEAIKQATIAGRVCDDVAWFDEITTLHDFCDQVLAAVGHAQVSGGENG